MPTGNSTPRRPDTESRFARLEEQVSTHGRQLVEIADAQRIGFRDIESHLAAMSDKHAAGQRVQWPALGVMLSIALAIGALAYWPIRESISDIRTSLRDAVSDTSFNNFVSNYELNRTIYREDTRRQAESAARALDQRFEALQREVDDLKRRAP